MSQFIWMMQSSRTQTLTTTPWDPTVIEKTLTDDPLSILPTGTRQGWEQVALQLRSPIWVSDILCFEEHAATIIIPINTH